MLYGLDTGTDMDTTFDSEQWTWRRAYTVNEDAGGLSNLVDVFDVADESDEVPVVIPTEFLTYLTQRHPNADISTIQLYCDNMEGTWKFGYIFDDESNVDLWSYKTLPDWLNPAKKSVPE